MPSAGETREHTPPAGAGAGAGTGAGQPSGKLATAPEGMST